MINSQLKRRSGFGFAAARGVVALVDDHAPLDDVVPVRKLRTHFEGSAQPAGSQCPLLDQLQLRDDFFDDHRRESFRQFILSRENPVVHGGEAQGLIKVTTGPNGGGMVLEGPLDRTLQLLQNFDVSS